MNRVDGPGERFCEFNPPNLMRVQLAMGILNRLRSGMATPAFATASLAEVRYCQRA
jgi:hypothetical protein